jgi:hypothetical protein
MKLVKVNQYRSKAGNLTFAYEVNGTKEELDQYAKIKEAEGYEVILSDNGKPLYFTTQPIGQTAELAFNQDGTRYYVPGDDQIDVMEALVKSEKDPEIRAYYIKALAELKMEKALSGIKKRATVTPETEPENKAEL